ncbi:hypothetical protein GGS20DRAFT_85960 [Poronia punctata]|nr:hypothetical protein GGS20DRAFT_85960 [Poronia punctata]
MSAEMDPTKIPAIPPPKGVESNFIDPESQQPQLIIASAITLFLVFLGISIRTYVKAALLRQFDLTDGVLLLCGVLFVAFVSVQIVAGDYGQGRHLWDVTAANFSQCLLILNIIEILYGPTMFAAKYVVLRQIEMVFFKQNRKAFWSAAIRILIWANFFFYGAIFLSFVLACIPREKISNPTLPGMCIDTKASIIATSAINVVSDFTILVTPIAAIWKLQMPLKKKLAAAAVFAVGIVGTLTSIVRLYYSVELTLTHDITWAIVPVASWALGEFASVILVACFPYFPRLWQHFTRKDQTSSYLISDDNTRGSKSKSSKLDNRHWNDSMTALKTSDREDGVNGSDIPLGDRSQKIGAAV